MLANADLDYGDEYGAEDNVSNEGDASRFLDKMMIQYAQRGDQRGERNADIDLEAELQAIQNVSGPANASKRPPPAVI